jgi:nitronate monooxygenase
MLTTELTRRFGIEHPIIQAGMGNAAGWELAAAVSEAGGLGTLGTIARTPDQVREEIEALRAATDNPFSVNVVAFDWAPFAADVLEAALDARPPVLTLSFGNAAERAAESRAAGQPTIVQVQDVTGLRVALESDADAVIVQGNEAGGHTGRRGTLSFVAQALAAANGVPVVAAGGIADGRGLAAALAMGCAGVVMGTRFKASREYREGAPMKDAIVASDGSDTVYDPIVDLAHGLEWPHTVTGRVLRNAFVDEWLGRDDELAAEVASRTPGGFVMELVEKGQGLNWAGEASGLIDEVLPARDIVQRTVEDAAALLSAVPSLFGHDA